MIDKRREPANLPTGHGPLYLSYSTCYDIRFDYYVSQLEEKSS